MCSEESPTSTRPPTIGRPSPSTSRRQRFSIRAIGFTSEIGSPASIHGAVTGTFARKRSKRSGSRSFRRSGSSVDTELDNENVPLSPGKAITVA